MKITRNYLKKLIEETLMNETRYKYKPGTELPIQQFYLWFKKIIQVLPKNTAYSCPDYVNAMGSSKKNAQEAKNTLVKIIRTDKKEKNDSHGRVWAIFWKQSDINYLADRELKPAQKDYQEFDLEKLYEIFSKDKRLANHVETLCISFNSKWDSEHHESVINSGPLD